jgi:ribose transport system substrate-binding protein
LTDRILRAVCFHRRAPPHVLIFVTSLGTRPSASVAAVAEDHMTTQVSSLESPAPTPTPKTPRRGSRLSRRILFLLVVLLAFVAILYYAGVFQVRPKIAIVTASQDPYWDTVIAGARDAATRYDVRLAVVRAPSNEDEQTLRTQDLLDKGYDGIAISPINVQKQGPLLQQIADHSILITFDSDCPVIGRLAFVGSDNYTAGRMCGEQVRAALASGGEVVISLGTIEKENGRQRRQGVIDELLDRSFEPSRGSEDPSSPVKGPKYTIYTNIDELNPDNATRLAVKTIKDHPNVKCFVGIFAYTTPALLKALEQSNKLGQIKLVGFDVNEQTLKGIEAGNVAATIAQDQYSTGFESVRILADAARGNRAGLPAFQMHYLGCTTVTRDNLADVRQSLKNPRGAAPASAPAVSAPATSTTAR